MQVSVETGDGLERRMRVELPVGRVQDEVEKRLQKLLRTIRLPGFRPGKVPLKLLRQRFGQQLEHEVHGELIQSSLATAVSEQSLRLAGAPHVAIEPAVDPATQGFSFTATFEVMPEFEVAPLAGLTVRRPVAEVTDADLEAVILRLREQRKTWHPVERPAQTGDRLTVSFVGSLDGVPFEGGSATSIPVELGAGRMLAGFEDGLVGASAGDTRTLDLSFPEGYPRADLAGRPVRFEVSVEAVAEPQVPTVDAEFVGAFGVTDGDLVRFRTEVRANMERELKQRLSGRTKEAVLDLLMGAHRVEVPAVLLAEEVRGLKAQMREGIGSSTVDLPDQLFAEPARRRVALGLIINEIVRRNGITAAPAGVRAAIESLASTYENPKEVVDYYYADRQRLAPVESMVLEEQVVEWVLGQVTVEDEQISFAQLTDPASVVPATR